MWRIALAFVPAALLVANIAHAAFIVDTGPASTSPIGFAVRGPDSLFGPLGATSLAGEFSFDRAMTISSLEGWMTRLPVPTFDGPESLHASIYSNGSGTPGDRLFTAEFNLPPCLSFSQESCTPSWNGPSNLSWALGAGTYWAVFEGIEGDTGVGAMPLGPPIPLANYQFEDHGTQGWSQLAAPFGVRIAGSPTPVNVPGPDTLSLLLLAGVLAAFSRIWGGKTSPRNR